MLYASENKSLLIMGDAIITYKMLKFKRCLSLLHQDRLIQRSALLPIQHANFSRKTKKTVSKKNSQEDDAFNPMGSDNDSGSKFEGVFTKAFIPKHPVVFDKESRKLTIFEISKGFKRIPQFTVPSYIISFASAMIMMDAFASLSLVKGFIFSLPFVSLLAMATYLTQQSAVMISKIELL